MGVLRMTRGRTLSVALTVCGVSILAAAAWMVASAPAALLVLGVALILAGLFGVPVR